jgi:hypothetical protein
VRVCRGTFNDFGKWQSAICMKVGNFKVGNFLVCCVQVLPGSVCRVVVIASALITEDPGSNTASVSFLGKHNNAICIVCVICNEK